MAVEIVTDDRRIVSLRVRKVDEMDKDTIYVNFDVGGPGYLYGPAGLDKNRIHGTIVTADAVSNIEFMSIGYRGGLSGLSLQKYKEVDTQGERVDKYFGFIPADAFVDHLVGHNDARLDCSEIISKCIPAYKQKALTRLTAEDYKNHFNNLSEKDIEDLTKGRKLIIG